MSIRFHNPNQSFQKRYLTIHKLKAVVRYPFICVHMYRILTPLDGILQTIQYHSKLLKMNCMSYFLSSFKHMLMFHVGVIVETKLFWAVMCANLSLVSLPIALSIYIPYNLMKKKCATTIVLYEIASDFGNLNSTFGVGDHYIYSTWQFTYK